MFEGLVAGLQGYQLQLEVTGGRRGTLELVDIKIEAGADYVFDGRTDRYEALNIVTGQMLAALDTGSVKAKTGAVLATFSYRASRDAAGAFVIDVLHDEDAGDQTFLVAHNDAKIEIAATSPAVIVVDGTPGPAR